MDAFDKDNNRLTSLDEWKNLVKFYENIEKRPKPNNIAKNKFN